MQKQIRMAKLVFSLSIISYSGVNGTQWLRYKIQDTRWFYCLFMYTIIHIYDVIHTETCTVFRFITNYDTHISYYSHIDITQYLS